ncbi:hybrid sensor histidine kinase/response regulator [Mangrovibrevibacter kandeliae]|uniref:hybrid sensor histidine kinase/response regulator n=1 Tax=Mangrovibrevibacter kandeliae TaxID=2968473 RepID=UPI0021177C1B|nr:PAS-domain containing protein [Aurantimonas sp. CSK15Z-1]MCQ8783286.1 PAS-domain containing protein [Aurantimonas sp. CSK15Z-1]
MPSWIIIAAAAGYLLLLFAVAWAGDRRRRACGSSAARPAIYALSLAVYCTSWTFFGSVGVAAQSGLGFLAIYLGPILVFLFAGRLIERIIRLAKAERITTVADFIGSRYGKSSSVAAIATLIALVGGIPYIALQLKAISTSVATLAAAQPPQLFAPQPFFGDLALLIAIVLGLFAILFGTRHADATEHQDGLVLAVAMESTVKLTAFLAAGLWVCFGLFSPGELWQAARASPSVDTVLAVGDLGHFAVATLLSAAAILLLPRQFHMTVVENRSLVELRRARWLFPLYLVAINLFVIPIAAAGLLRLSPAGTPDLYVLSLPLAMGNQALALLVFVGGLSAATAMVIVASVALSVMISNSLVLPMLLRRRARLPLLSDRDEIALILNIRRGAILAIALFGYVYYRLAGDGAGLAEIGLLSFAAIAQLAPALLIGLRWKRANARGAKAGMIAGIAVWFYALLLPAVLPGCALVESGPFGIAALKPQALLGLSIDPLAHGVFWSLALNVAMLFTASLTRRAAPLERIQAATFVQRGVVPLPSLRRQKPGVSVGELKAAVGRYLGAERAERSFQSFAAEAGEPLPLGVEPADGALLRHCEQLLGSTIGSASARLVLSLLVERNASTSPAAIRLLDDASQAVQHNRDLLHIGLEQVDQGLAIFDPDYRLSFWNRQFRLLLGLPPQFGQVGVSLASLLEQLHLAGEIGHEEFVRAFGALTRSPAMRQLALAGSGRTIEIRANAMPDGGTVVTVSDMTERVRQARVLRELNETLEQRVRERTGELVRANADLAEARRAAEAANLGKTRFLAAAGHDILQPLNAARLYAAALGERLAGAPTARLADNVASSLESVDAILAALLDISRLDAGGMAPKFEDVRLDALLHQVETDLRPLAEEGGVRLTLVNTAAVVRTDRNLLRRLVQNLLSNAIKYAPGGRVVVGARRSGGGVTLQIVDDGIGIPDEQKDAIFREFVRLDEGSRTARGLGLGLSIVDRIARILDHPVNFDSVPGRGTRFRVALPPGHEPALSAPPPAVPEPSSHNMALRGARALCISPDEALQDALARLLSSWGCEAICAQDLAAARDRLASGPTRPDILLVDNELGEGTGVTAIARLRSVGEDEPRTILITADRTPALFEQAAMLGIDVLTKPLKPASLRAALGRHSPRRAAAE